MRTIWTGSVLVTQSSRSSGEGGKAGPRVTRTEALRQQLSDDIIKGTLEPGSPLDEADLARRFGVSRTPVREAIRNLAASGLVETRPHRGAVVALPTPSRLMDMFKAMAELEALCAGLAAESMTAAERDALEKLHEEMADFVLKDDAAKYRERNERFHGLIYAGAHNSYLSEIAVMTRARVSPFRRAQFSQPGRIAESHREHGLVVKAIVGGDRNDATDQMRLHIDIVRDAYRRLSAR
ncbi:MAG: GntR family transcriptional regulator [Bauldia sp.]|nr:GntR family transcriptional regulator [Bauldia sp.]